jgi:hypothetical protein
MTNTKAAAHIITADAVALGQPEILITTHDEGMGARVIETLGLGAEHTLDDVVGDFWAWTPRWRVVGTPAQVGTGYWVADVELV